MLGVVQKGSNSGADTCYERVDTVMQPGNGQVAGGLTEASLAEHHHIALSRCTRHSQSTTAQLHTQTHLACEDTIAAAEVHEAQLSQVREACD